MEILWLAILVYSIGLAVVLHFRPAVMFHENGVWKEFGYQRSSGHTLFPFWLFAITWAFSSYAMAAGISWAIVSGPGMIPVAAAAIQYTSSPLDEFMSASASAASSPDEEDYESELEVPTPKKKAPPRPGYYVLDPSSRETGLRRYIYYGQKAPEDA